MVSATTVRSPPQRITTQIRAEGVDRIAVVSDDIEKYANTEPFAASVTIHHRDELDAVQRELRAVAGVSAIVYDQTCAAEKRRREKRAARPRPDRRVLINELVCEGCGDCSKQSNCLSVTPVETEFGRKRRIDQSSCNKDFSCSNGFCPSFVTVEGAKPRPAGAADLKSIMAAPLPEPSRPTLDQPWNVLVTGIGGTGVVTIGAILAMAAHIEEKGASTLDMTGMAQKGGAVTTHLRIASRPEELHTVRIPQTSANLALGCDIVVAGSKEALGLIAKGKSRIILNSEETITGEFTRNQDSVVPAHEFVRIIRDIAGDQLVETVNSTRIAARLLGDSIGSNLFMVGFAYQRGLIPVSSESIVKAIRLNGVAIDMNETAFRLGRFAASEGEAQLLSSGADIAAALDHRKLSSSLDELIARRAAFLTEYQDALYARQYLEFVERVRRREAETMGSVGKLTEAVGRSLFKLMAYKDEYEVARLYTHASFSRQIAEMSDGSGRLTFHLAPPLFAPRNPHTGELRKIAFGPWVLTAFRALAPLKRLRGTAFDIFGYAAERRTERRLIVEYRAAIERIIATLTPDRFGRSLAVAEVPDAIRGFGHVKERNIAKARALFVQLERDLALTPASVEAA